MDIGSQIRQQDVVRVFRIDLDRVHHHVLGHGRVKAHLANRALKLAARKSVHRERDRRARFDAADIGFVDGRPDLHLRQIPRDEEQARCVQAGNDCLADVHAAINDDAADRRVDGAEIQIALRLVQIGLRLRDSRTGDGDIGLGDFIIRLAGIEVCRRNQFAGEQFL